MDTRLTLDGNFTLIGYLDSDSPGEVLINGLVSLEGIQTHLSYPVPNLEEEKEESHIFVSFIAIVINTL